MTDTTGATGTAQDLVITREFDAAREMVWRAWSEPEQFARWFGPRGYTIPHCEIDFRVGGRIFYAMRSADGQQIWATGVFKEIVPLERMVFTDSFADEHGNAVPATHYGMSAAYPLEMLITVTFEEHAGKTKMTLRHSGLPAIEETGGGEGEGWGESFEKLAEYLAEVA